MARNIPITELGREQIELLLNSIAEKLDTDLAVPVALAHPELGLLIAARKPEILQYQKVWAAIDSDLAVTVFESLSTDHQNTILHRLLSAGAIDPLLSICERLPDVWWTLLFASSDVPEGSLGILVARANTLRTVLDRIGSAAISTPQGMVQSPSQSLLLLLAADLSSGLWRRCPNRTWQKLAHAIETPSTLSFPLPDYVRDRVHAVALLTATASAAASQRTIGWIRSFGYLHERLKRPTFDGEAWRVLANTLPSGSPDWDRCHRLRRGLVAEVRRDNWSQDDIAIVVKAAGNFGRDIKQRLDPPEPGRKKNILEQLIDQLFS